jgi:hypothetical protein
MENWELTARPLLYPGASMPTPENIIAVRSALLHRKIEY